MTHPSTVVTGPRVVVLVDYDDLVRSVAGATLMGSNTRISPSEARRLACDADILPVVLGSDSQILDVGRTTRLFTGDLRQAIAVRDRGCVFPGVIGNRVTAKPTTSCRGPSAARPAWTTPHSSVPPTTD